jgi:hypothetical protein
VEPGRFGGVLLISVQLPSGCQNNPVVFWSETSIRPHCCLDMDAGLSEITVEDRIICVLHTIWLDIYYDRES